MININLSSILSAALIFLCLSTSQKIFSQDIVLDSMISGKTYRITLYNDKEVIGRVTKQDSAYTFLKTESGVVRVRNEDIFSVSASTIPRLNKALFSLGGGVLLNSGEDYHYYDNNNNKPGLSFQGTALIPLSENKGIRFDLSYSRFHNDPVVYAYYSYSPPETYSSQNVEYYSMYGEFVFGNFLTETGFSVYGLGGLGATHRVEGPYTYTYYNSYDSTLYVHDYPGNKTTTFSMNIGAGCRIKLSNKLGLFAEAQYNMSTYEGFFFFFWGTGHFPIRAGLTYSFY